jgi:hypothetical protein
LETPCIGQVTKTDPIMKLLSFLAHATLISAAAFLLGLAFDVQALPLFGLAITVALLLIASRDYVPSHRQLRVVALKAPGRPGNRNRPKYKLPFAA